MSDLLPCMPCDEDEDLRTATKRLRDEMVEDDGQRCNGVGSFFLNCKQEPPRHGPKMEAMQKA